MSNIGQIQRDLDSLYQSVWDTESNQLKLVDNSRYEDLLDKVNLVETEWDSLVPSVRLTHSIYTDSSSNKYVLFGLLDNARSGGGCDTNFTYSWFVGLMTPVDGVLKDNTSTKFVVMYNDTSYDSDNENYLDVSDWHIVFAVDVDGVVDLS